MEKLKVIARELNPEVFIACDAVVKVSRLDVDFLKAKARGNPRRKCRLLLHRSVDDLLHEMLIVHTRNQYICPHKNMNSSKSYHIVEGGLACILFSDDGQIVDYCIMGEYSDAHVFTMRFSESRFHTLIPLTDTVVFVETVLGPFRGTVYADWAPRGEWDGVEGQEYVKKLRRAIGIGD